MRRFACLSVITAIGLGALASVPAANASVTLGISDQLATTFTSPLFAPLKIKNARYVAPYDVALEQSEYSRLDPWYAAAKAKGQTLLVSFEHSRIAGKQTKAPTLGQYTTAIKAFKKRYPAFKVINTWNEVNACQKAGGTERQPKNICTASHAKLLYQYYGADKTVFSGKTIIPLDVLDDRSSSASTAVAYIKAFKKLSSKKPPKILGLHNYSDTNRFSEVRTKKILKAWGKSDVWLLETGGQLSVFGGTEANKEASAAKALKCMFYISKQFKQIKRMYVYQYNAPPANSPAGTFDAGLVNANGTPRPGYTVVLKRQSAKC